MGGLPLTAFDVAVLGVVGLSILVALVRGAIRELLSLATWIGTVVIAYLAFPYVRELAARTIDEAWMADAAALAVVVVVPLIGLKLVASILANHVPGGLFGTFDRITGVAFGAVRGAVLVSAAYLGMTMLLPADEQPPWIKEARLRAPVARGAELLRGLVPEQVEARGRRAVGEAEAAGRDVLNRAVEDLGK
jgi:membrane protein required for colicin V production